MRQSRISLIAGLILIGVTLLVGATVFNVMQRHAQALLRENLQSSLRNYIRLSRIEIDTVLERTTFVATRPLLMDQMSQMNTGAATDVAASRMLNQAAQTLLQTGFTAIALFDKNGRLVAHAGKFTHKSALTVALDHSGQAKMMWDGQLLLSFAANMKQDGRIVGSVVTEAPLPLTMENFREAGNLGKTGELVLCARAGRQMQCFPSTLHAQILTLSEQANTGSLLPMAYAMRGQTGFITTRDYWDRQVAAAYAPVDNLGLGMVLKVDAAELYAPVWKQLRYVIPLLSGVVLVALLLLRWLFTPLVVRLVRSEAEANRASAGLRDSEHRLRALLNGVDEGITTISATGVIDLFNPGAERIFGYSSAEVTGKNISILMPEPFRSEHAGYLVRYLQTGQAFVIGIGREVSAQRANGDIFPMDLRVSEFYLNGQRQFIGIMRDITEKKKSEELLWTQANFDALTQLPNRHMFYDRLIYEIKKAHRSGLSMALLLLDLDRFKEVNDTMGHAQGDVLLVEVARRIVQCVRETDTVARIGGDEFTVILAELNEAGAVDRITQNILAQMSLPFQLGDERAFISASIGISFCQEQDADAYVLLKNADQAMYAAKAEGRNRYNYFTLSMQETARIRMQMANDLHDALSEQQFRVYYQPIVTLSNGAIHKAEALIRWQHPVRGLVNPAEFVPLLEETGMIVEVGNWVFRQAAEQAARWRASHHAKFQISVNVSPTQFRHYGVNFGTWFTYLREIGLSGQSIVVEITEGLLLDVSNSVTSQLLAFRDAGIRVSLDDFGTGYSSLSYLKKFDIDYLKIDQSFVHDLASDANDMALCEAIIVMAHKLGLKVIAEGVETEEQRNLLAAAGCDYGQGYFFAKPILPEDFDRLLMQGPVGSGAAR